MTYFHMGNPHYHRRGVVSLSCSGWEGVGPTRYGRQTNWQANCVVLQLTVFVVRCFGFNTSSTNAILEEVIRPLGRLPQSRFIPDEFVFAS